MVLSNTHARTHMRMYVRMYVYTPSLLSKDHLIQTWGQKRMKGRKDGRE